MKESFRSLVEPRAFSPITKEPLPLVDLVLEEQDSRHRTIRLVGHGIQTAISYLQDALQDYPNICIVGPSEIIDSPQRWDVVVYASSGVKVRPRADLELKIKGWGRDEVIEYVLAKSTARCKSVMARLEASGDLWLGSGSPRILSIVLDQMIESDEVVSVEDGILRFYDSIDLDTKTRRKVSELCLEHIFSDSKAVLALYDSDVLDDDVVSFLGIETVRYAIAADMVVKMLEKGSIPNVMSKVWPRGFIGMIAGKLGGHVEAASFLTKLANEKRSRCAANAVSLLVANDQSWLPSIDEEHQYSGAKLAKVNWNGQSFRLASMTDVDLSQANLSKCNFEKATLIGGDFFGACFSRAILTQASAASSILRKASLRFVSAHKSNFQRADLTDANLEGADFSNAKFGEANLTNANLSNCDLKLAQFENAELENANFSFANLQQADLFSANLRTANLEGTNFSRAGMKACDLRTQVLDGNNFFAASLKSALLTGTVFRNCDLRKVKLSNARMADIDWEDCDMRKANFFNCRFLMGSTRAGTVDSPYPSHGTRTGFYTDDFDDHYFKRPQEIRKANLCRCNLLEARVFEADFYLVDLRGAIYDEAQRVHFQKCGAILSD